MIDDHPLTTTYDNTLTMSTSHTVLLPHVIKTPSIKKLEGKRVVLASSSPRRKDILQTFVRRSIARNIYLTYAFDIGIGTRDNTIDVLRGSGSELI